MRRTMVVAGATGFVGRSLVDALLEERHVVRACARRVPEGPRRPGVQWRACDLLDPRSMHGVFDGADCAWYLVHSMGAGRRDYAQLEERSARNFLREAEASGLRRIVYLGGVAAPHNPSVHLASRQHVGEILRSGKVNAIELRAAMIIGPGSVSWQIVRDLSLRLPAMVLPRWLGSRTCPVALEDVILALVGAADVPCDHSAWFDLPGPEVLTGRQIIERVAALRGRRIPSLAVPFLTPRLSSLWLRLITRADFPIARELVAGLQQDLLPQDSLFWELIGHRELIGFDEAASRSLQAERAQWSLGSIVALAEEKIVDRLGPRARVRRTGT